MKLIVANYRYFVAGGPEKYMFKFKEAAEEMGIQIIPFSVDNPQNEETPYKEYFARPRANKLMYHDTRFSFGNMVGWFRATVWNWDAERKLSKLIQDTKPDAVYILHEVNHLSPSIIRSAKKEGVRVIHRISDFFMFCPRYDFLCGDSICESCLHGRYGKAIQHRCVKGSLLGTLLRVLAMKVYSITKVFDDVDHFICTCNFTKGKMIEGGISAERISVVPTFIDASQIVPCYENQKYFLFLGRMAHQKGVIIAIEAMKYLKDHDYVLKITGSISDSEEDQKIWNYIVENGLGNRVVFTGFMQGEQLDDLIRGCAAVLCPAIWYENMPNTVIEAYAYGKPVVASRVGSLAEIVEDGKTGFLFEMGNAHHLAEQLEKLAADDHLVHQLGENARRKCDAEYNKRIHMKAVLDICGYMDSVEGKTDE